MKKEYNYFASIIADYVEGTIEINEEELEKEEITVIKNILDYKIIVDKVRKKVEFSVYLKKYPNIIKSELFELSELVRDENIQEIKADLNSFLDKQAIIWVKDITRFKLEPKLNHAFF